MDFADRFFIASVLTLALLVLLLERRNRLLDPQLIPPPPGARAIDSMNVPRHRDATRVINDVAYMDVTDAAEGANEND